MLALSLDTAKNIAIAVVLIFVVGGIAAFWVMKTIVQKLVVAGVLAVLVFAVWSQRTSLQDCADQVKTNFELVGADVLLADSSCSFFGFDVTISDPRGD